MKNKEDEGMKDYVVDALIEIPLNSRNKYEV